jgi:hypothetical protein
MLFNDADYDDVEAFIVVSQGRNERMDVEKPSSFSNWTQKRSHQQQQRYLPNGTAPPLTSAKSTVVVRARKCTCANSYHRNNYTYYCPENKNSCYLPRDPSAPYYYTPTCVNRPGIGQDLLRTVWPVLISMVVFLSACLLCTQHGCMAIFFVLSLPCPYLNRLYTRYLLWRQPERANTLIRRWCVRRRAELDDRYLQMEQQQAVEGGEIERSVE